jgi:hypothetical protein
MVSNAVRFGFDSTLGSFGALALSGLVAVLGIWLVVKSRDPTTGKRNNTMFAIGLAIIVSTALPMLPYFGLSLAFDELTNP